MKILIAPAHTKQHVYSEAKRYTLQAKRFLGVLVSLLGLLSAMAHAAEPVNHYIVLFDASGSVREAYKHSANFWQGKTQNSEFMAQRLATLVNKALREPPQDSGVDFPPIKPSDLFSFLLFRLEYEQPSYQLSHLFMTNERLLLHPGLPAASTYQSFQFQSGAGKRGAKELAEALGGFSPLVAATTGALPFLGQSIPARNQLVRRTFIIRITDGSYNAEANAADEYAVILRHIDAENRRIKGSIPYPDHYPAYRELSRRVNAAFDIGSRSKDCVLITHEVADALAKPFDCRYDAFTKLKYGMGFMISYLEIIPRRPSLDTLAVVEKRTLELQPQVHNQVLEYIGANTVLAASIDDDTKSIYPVQAEWKLGETAAWRPCQEEQAIRLREDSNILDCPGSGGTLHLGVTKGEVRLAANGLELLDSLYYRIAYKHTFTGSSPLYPFVYAVEPITLPVHLRVEPTALPSKNDYYPPPPSVTSTLPPWIDPRRLVWTQIGQYLAKPRPVNDKLLVEVSRLPEYQEHNPLTPQKLAKLSQVASRGYQGQEQNYDLQAQYFYASVAVLGMLMFLFWPRRNLRAASGLLAESGVVLDFNAREYEQIVLVGIAQVQNIARSLNRKAFRLTISIEEPKFFLANAETPKPVPLDIQGERRLAAVARPGQMSLDDRNAVSDKEYPLYFDPRAIQDCRLPVPHQEHELQVTIHAVMEAWRQETQNLDYSFRLVLRPEHASLDVIPEGVAVSGDVQQRFVEVDY